MVASAEKLTAQIPRDRLSSYVFRRNQPGATIEVEECRGACGPCG